MRQLGIIIALIGPFIAVVAALVICQLFGVFNFRRAVELLSDPAYRWPALKQWVTNPLTILALIGYMIFARWLIARARFESATTSQVDTSRT